MVAVSRLQPHQEAKISEDTEATTFEATEAATAVVVLGFLSYCQYSALEVVEFLVF